MAKDMTWLASVSVSTLMTACVVSTRPPPPAGPREHRVEAPPPAPPARPHPGPVAADNGQPKMHATLQALDRALHELAGGASNKGGFRQSALHSIELAKSEVSAGIAYAEAHPTEVGPAAPPAPLEPVNTNVPGAERQPNMARTMVALREARQQLLAAKGDKGGHRAKALQLIEQAMGQVRDGIAYANQHP